MAARLDPEDMLELARRDQNAGGRDEPRDHRMAQEICQKPQTEDAEQQQEAPGKTRERQRGDGIARCALLGDLTDGGGCQKRDHCHRPHRERAGGAENRVEEDRCYRGVDPRLWRQACQKRIGKRLRNQHYGHDHRRDEIFRQRRSIILPAPCKDRQITRKSWLH